MRRAPVATMASSPPCRPVHRRSPLGRSGGGCRDERAVCDLRASAHRCRSRVRRALRERPHVGSVRRLFLSLAQRRRTGHAASHSVAVLALPSRRYLCLFSRLMGRMASLACLCCRTADALKGDHLCGDCGEYAAVLEFDGGLSRPQAERAVRVTKVQADPDGVLRLFTEPANY
jgi:hypothetical protein